MSSRPVYSTGRGRLCPSCGRPVKRCVCRASPRVPRGDGIVRVRREVVGRGGKTVTSVSGLPLASDALKELAAELKRRCGSGGTTRSDASGSVIEIQGDHRETLVRELESRGYSVVLAGG